MANSVHNIPINVMPQAQPQGPVVPDNTGVIDYSAAEKATSQASNDNRTYEADAQAPAENANSNQENQVNEGKGEDFQDVLERKLSNKSEDRRATADDEKPQNSENKTKDNSEENICNLSGLIDINTREITNAITGKAKKQAPTILVKPDKDAKPITKAVSDQQQKIIDIPAINIAKDSSKSNKKDDLVALAAAETTKVQKPTGDSTKGTEVKQIVQEAVGKEAKAKDTNPDTTQLADKPAENKMVNTNKLKSQDTPVAKQSQKAADAGNTDQATDPGITANDKIDPTDFTKIAETTDKAIKPEMLAENKPKSTESVDKPQKIENLQIDPKEDKGNANQTLENALNDQNAKTEKEKINANVDFNNIKAQNETAVNSIADTPVANTNQTAVSGNITGVQSVASASAARADALQPQSPTDQIIDAVRTQDVTPSRQINISLNPAELGRVRISFQQSDGEITGMIEVEKSQTRVDIEKAIPQIVNSLQDSGVQVKKIEVIQDNGADTRRQQSDMADQFEQANSRNFSDGSYSSSKNQSETSARGSQLGNDYQLEKGSVSHISDDAISAYA